jgi:acyl carrier protein
MTLNPPTLDDVLEGLAPFVKQAQLSGDSLLAEAGIDSLDVVEWLFQIESRYEVVVDDAMVMSFKDATVAEIHAGLVALIARPGAAP